MSLFTTADILTSLEFSSDTSPGSFFPELQTSNEMLTKMFLSVNDQDPDEICNPSDPRSGRIQNADPGPEGKAKNGGKTGTRKHIININKN
jgi:hypothetical protein